MRFEIFTLYLQYWQVLGPHIFQTRNMIEKCVELLAPVSNRIVPVHKLRPSIPFKAYWLLSEPQFCMLIAYNLCFEWISEKTVIFALFITSRLVFITEVECLLRGTV
jgi:hypothetical protein